jgi:hypothetical protein
LDVKHGIILYLHLLYTAYEKNIMIHLYIVPNTYNSEMNNIALLTIFIIVGMSVGAATFAWSINIPSATAQEQNGTMAGNLTTGVNNMTDTNMTNGTGNISGVEDPF